MSFTSLEFLFLFFPLTLAGYYLLKNKCGNLFLLAASLVFYTLGEKRMFLILPVSILVNYGFGLLIGKTREKKTLHRILFTLSLIFNFGLLFYYKYFLFTLETVNSVFGTDITWARQIFLPLGLSFFTFRTLSYCIDVYWESVQPEKNIVNVALYISFFPQVTMGPISRYNDFAVQLKDRKFEIAVFAEGIRRIITGLAKKLIISDTVGYVVDIIFRQGSGERTVLLAWLGIIGYLIQLYYDFSGYSDIAVGLGKLFGFTTPENFDYPYMSKGIAEYWSRWHITLGTWLKNYLYTPIFRACQDKNMKKDRCDRLALIGVWLFAGIWHGTGWNYLAYGIYYCVFIILERLWDNYKKTRRKRLGLKKKPDTFLQSAGKHVYFLVVLIFGQLLFRCESMIDFLKYGADMFGLRHNAFGSTLTAFYFKQLAAALAIGILFCFPVVPKIRKALEKSSAGKKIVTIAEPVICLLLFVIAIAFAFTSTYHSFVYFQF